MHGSTNAQRSVSSSESSSVELVPSRAIRERTRVVLAVKAGGRCEFDGCNEYLLEHPITHEEGMFAQAAHIVAFKRDGARGRSGERPSDLNAVHNLMLLCPHCHKLIDDNPAKYPRQKLEEQK